MTRRDTMLALASVLLLWASLSLGQQLQGPALVAALQQGGHVLVMRHANAPGELPDAASADPGNVNLERQLDQFGKDSATAMGQALRRLGIPIGQVLSSPAFRTLETANYLGLTELETVDFLASRGMEAVGEEIAIRLRRNVVTPAERGNRLLITHSEIIGAAFPNLSPGVAQGEVLVFQPAGNSAELIARVQIGQWPGF